jgi:hypothetical protein
VRQFRTIVVTLLALAWAPLTAHCQLERVTGLPMLRCSAADEAPAARGSHCDNDSCCGWETGLYQLPRSQPLTSIQPGAVVQPVWSAVAAGISPMEVEPRLVTAAPLYSPRPWQFFLRAAPPARAPSFAS